MQIPFYETISKSRHVLLAGAGGGFDIASGIPLYLYLRRCGIQVTLANLSFSQLQFSDCKEISCLAYRVCLDSSDLPYFPEKHILEWLQARGELPSMYAFSNSIGVNPLRAAYENIVNIHEIDTLVVVDGGTDSLMFGDEHGVGTIVEDACSIVAANSLGIERSYLIADGFGVENYHGLNHHACLENMAALTKANAFLGAYSLSSEMSDGLAYLQLIEYLNSKNSRVSIVANSIASAMKGEFGDFHFTHRTEKSEQFISPLMSIFWHYKLSAIAERITFRSRIEETQTMDEVAQAFSLHRAMNTRRPKKLIPLG